MQTSTLPSYWVAPPTSRTSPYKQADEGCRYKIFYGDACWVYLWGVTYYHCQAQPTQFFFLYHILPNLSLNTSSCHLLYNRSWRMLYYFRCRQEVPKRGGTSQWSQKASVYASTRQDKQQTASLSHCMRKAKELECICTAWVGVLFLKYRHMLTTALRSHNCPSRMLWLCQAESNRRGRTEPGWNNKWRQTHIYYYIIYLV